MSTATPPTPPPTPPIPIPPSRMHRLLDFASDHFVISGLAALTILGGSPFAIRGVRNSWEGSTIYPDPTIAITLPDQLTYKENVGMFLLGGEHDELNFQKGGVYYELILTKKDRAHFDWGNIAAPQLTSAHIREMHLTDNYGTIVYTRDSLSKGMLEGSLAREAFSRGAKAGLGYLTELRNGVQSNYTNRVRKMLDALPPIDPPALPLAPVSAPAAPTL